VRSLSGEAGHLLRLRTVEIRLPNRSFRYDVESTAANGRTVLIKLAGVETREQAEELRNAELWVERSQAAPLKANEYYARDLCGCRVMYAGRLLGRVHGLVSAGSRDLLEVRKETGEIVLVPFLDHYLAAVDLAEKTIHLKEDLLFT
jgi:16S rRNA processing protein RimM